MPLRRIGGFWRLRHDVHLLKFPAALLKPLSGKEEDEELQGSLMTMMKITL